MGGGTGSHRSRVLNEIGLRFLGGDFAFYSATRQSKPKPATELQMARIAEHRVVPWRGREVENKDAPTPRAGLRGACHPGALGVLGTLGTTRGIRYRGLHAPGLAVNPNGSVPPLVSAAIQGHAGDSLDSGILHIILGSRQYRVTSRAAARG